MTDRYAVFGNPIAHSKSPLIHAQFAKQTAQDLSYTAELAPLEGFDDAVSAFFETGGCGCNVTVPFKLDAARFADKLSEAATRAGAVNTLVKQGSEIYGDTTDGSGMVRDIESNHGEALADNRVLILGAGGAVRGVLQPLLAAAPRHVHIANRTAQKAEQLALAFSELGDISGGSLDAIDAGPFDIIVNGTSSGLSADVPRMPESCVVGAMCYDMFYTRDETPFQAWCRLRGARKSVDGLGMLVEQAADSFAIWRGVRPETRATTDHLRALLSTPN
ncbi:MAG: shikimate dehydrogenase [Pseudomonadota bacterium]